VPLGSADVRSIEEGGGGGGAIRTSAEGTIGVLPNRCCMHAL
jgi:hypothetical protein